MPLTLRSTMSVDPSGPMTAGGVALPGTMTCLIAGGKATMPATARADRHDAEDRRDPGIS
jgi:hypothetical protein